MRQQLAPFDGILIRIDHTDATKRILTHDERHELAFLAGQGLDTWHFRAFRRAALVSLERLGYVEQRRSRHGNVEWAVTTAGVKVAKEQRS